MLTTKKRGSSITVGFRLRKIDTEVLKRRYSITRRSSGRKEKSVIIDFGPLRGKMREKGYTHAEIAERLGYKTHRAVMKRLKAIKSEAE